MLGLYYRLKPYLPAVFRLALRRAWAKSRPAKETLHWPICEAAGAPPPGWPGWPDNKQFAFVLTHDVEGVTGLNKCRKLMQLNQRLGFRASFNFVPEGEYRLEQDIRTELEENGFEVGVHDLRHDGFLYRSRESFSRDARRINDYLKAWSAQGFRSGLMHHRLNWLGDLEVLYDASTFDTDPYEPQPDGMKTIFPFWIPTNSPSGGYVELPYTLVQDYNLFIVLQRKTIDVWKQKLDWVAARGGMALVIVHPDYINFDNSWKVRGEYPVALYEELLAYVNERYGDSCWPALPREVAAYAQQFKPRLHTAKTELSSLGLEHWIVQGSLVLNWISA